MPDLHTGAARIRRLVARMTLREKVGQLNQRLHGWDAVRRGSGGWELTDTFHEEVARWSGLGALYGVFRSDAWSGRGWHNGIAPEDRTEVAGMIDAAVRAASAHGTGALIVEEAPHGHQALGAPLLPVNLNVGSTWNPELYGEACRSVSALMRADGVHLALVSALDMLRDPRWGRAEECFGESAFLSGQLTTALVTGMQGTGRVRMHEGSGVGVVLKHFAAQGDGVGGRNGHAVSIGRRDLAEIHLPAARAGVTARAAGVMAAYNDIDGVPCCANHDLLSRTLRDEWGFEGIVMADGNAVDRLVGSLGSPLAAGAAALRAGVDVSLWDESFTVLEAAAGLDPSLVEAIDRACIRVLTLKDEFGLLAPAPTPPKQECIALASVESTRMLSREVAAESLILLHNEGALPARPTGFERWAVIGEHADAATSLLGDYVPPLAPQSATTIHDALRDRAHRAGVEVVRVDHSDLRSGLAGIDRVIVVVGGTSHRDYTDEFAANGAIAGRTAADSGEGVDRADISLPNGQDDLMRAVRAATDVPVVAIAVMGRPYVLTDVVDNSDATLLAWYPGPEGAEPIAEVVFGDREPRGRLSVTLPAHPGVVPVHADDRQSATDVYRDVPDPILRPLGFGLGYGSLTATAARCEVEPTTGDVAVEVDLVADPVEATGWHGSVHEIVQVYIERAGSVVVPRRAELVGFHRVVLDPEARATVRLSIPADRAFIDPSDVAPLAQAVTTFTIVVGADHLTARIDSPR